MCTGCAALDVLHWMCSCCALHARCMQHSTHYVITTPTPTRVTLHASIRRRGVTSPGPRPRLSMARFTLAILTRAALSIAALAMAGSDALSASLGPMRSRTSRCGKTCPFWSGCVAPPRAVPAPPSPCAYRMCIWTVRCVGTTILLLLLRNMALLTMAGRRGLQCRHDQVQGEADLPECTVAAGARAHAAHGTQLRVALPAALPRLTRLRGRDSVGAECDVAQQRGFLLWGRSVVSLTDDPVHYCGNVR